MFTADVKTAFLNAHMKDGDVVYAKTATRMAAGNTGSENRNSDQKSLWPETRTETLPGPSGADPRECAASSRTCWTLACAHTQRSEYQSYSHVDHLLLAGKHQIIKEILTELGRNLELKSSAVSTKPTRYLGRTLVKNGGVYNFGVDAPCVESMLEEVQRVRAQELTNTALGTP